MKLLRLFSWLLLLAGLIPLPLRAGAEVFRTDINPALRYYLAMLQAPNLSPADHQFLYTPDWRGKVLDEQFGALVSQYDPQFKLLRQARFAKVPCDWGLDLSEGPDAVLPGLAKAKLAAQTSRLRTSWHLQQGKPEEAREDLLAAFCLGRNLSRDRVLISALVQFAMENIVISVVAENYFRLSPEILKQVVEGMHAAPARGTIAECVPTEKSSFQEWLLRKVQSLQKETAGDETAFLNELRQIFARSFPTDEGADGNYAETLITVSGGKSERILAMIRELDPWYKEVATLMTLPYQAFLPRIKEFDAKIQASANPMLPQFFRVFGKCRNKEFAAEVRQAMLRAAVEYKLRGMTGLQSVKDPCGDGPFQFERFQLAGVDRGFTLRSAFQGTGFADVLIFTEKDGPAFYISGPNAGKPLPVE